MTAIAAWMLVCIFFVFFALVGFVINIIVIIIIILFRYAYLLWKKKKSCLKRKKNKKQSEDEGKLRVARKEDYRSKVIFFTVIVIFTIAQRLFFSLLLWLLLSLKGYHDFFFTAQLVKAHLRGGNWDWPTLPLILSAYKYFRLISLSFYLHPNISDRFPFHFIFVEDKMNNRPK